MSSERTEEATPKKLREARRRGQVPKSRELTTALLLLGTAAALRSLGAGWLEEFRALGALVLAGVAHPAPGLSIAIGARAFEMAGLTLAPVFAVLVVAAVLGSVVQTGPLFASEAVSFDVSRLDPIAGARRLVSLRGLVELFRGLLKLLVTFVVLYVTLRDAAHGIASLSLRPAASVLEVLGTLGTTLLFRTGGALLALGVLDLVYQRWQFARDQRMTKDEVKREHKEQDGDPHVKRERERARREIAQHDLLESVRRASVVVVNPTHLAVALRFDEDGESDAPEIVGKGQDELARRIIAVAREAGVPVMQDVNLARGLFELEVGQEIPERLYEAVAAVLRAAWAEQHDAESAGPEVDRPAIDRGDGR